MDFEIPYEIVKLGREFGISETNLIPTNFVFYVIIPFAVTYFALHILMKNHLKIFKGSASFVNVVIPFLMTLLAIKFIAVTSVICSLYLMFIEKWPFAQSIGPFQIANTWIKLIARFGFWIGAYYLYFTLPPYLTELILNWW